jgi:membrane protein DedA with SNARE-associated domain
VLASISASFTSQVASHGVYAVFVLMAIDAVFPAASELVMVVAGAIAAGVLASANGVTVLGWNVGFGLDAYIVLALAGTLGYLAGAIGGWAIGRYGGRPVLERHGRWFHITPDRLERAEAWFGRWGNLGVLVGRVTPIVRSFVSIPAGVFEMPLGTYTVLTLIGSAIWAFGFAGVGYALGANYNRVDHDFRYVEYAVIAGVLMLVAYLVYRWFAAARVRERAEEPAR